MFHLVSAGWDQVSIKPAAILLRLCHGWTLEGVDYAVAQQITGGFLGDLFINITAYTTRTVKSHNQDYPGDWYKRGFNYDMVL